MAAALGLAATLPALPAVAGTATAQSSALAAPTVTAVTTAGVGLAWPDHAGAHHYEVRHSTSPAFTDAVVEEKYNSRYVDGLANATTYHIQYRALTRPPGAPYGTYVPTGWSDTLTVTTEARFPGAFTTLEATGGLDSITVRWNETAYTTHYTVVVADDHKMTRNKRTFENVTGTSLTVRDLSQGSRTGMPTFVKVSAHNKTYLTRTSRRLTAYAAAPEVAGTETLRFAAQNLLCSTCKVPGKTFAPWATRVKTHLATIKAQNPDVLILNEAANQPLPGTKKVRSMDGFVAGLKKQGYALDSRLEKAGQRDVPNRVAYKSAKYALVDKGWFKLPTARGENQRTAAWVLLKSRRTGKEFYAVSTHVSVNLPQTGATSKESSAELVVRRMAGINGQDLPMVLGGDMNSSFYQQPNAPHSAFIADGWTDTASSANRTNYLYPTTHYGTGRKLEQTYGRIDYLFTKNIAGTVSYRNVITVKDGTVVSKHGSDHTMVTATAKLP
ncbi:hypothetical protein NCCP1664_05030 [Zafaria cholistanensis]|uniref:Endonuclease/exonuclease/phosphatase domain-containing protein n=1 Tax=Zafaria cholistanensis TaxID=1682741 RepID=A0A5A7NNA8_9MICC|nr:hypothetical protein [Zafaria cholistanensis]GER22006.1 hypothetical protein NCCP1664_05030 [Zafaria cholistanensis]